MERQYFTIGTADLDIENFRKFRNEERERKKRNEKCWPAALWQEYFYQHQDLSKYAEKGYYDINGLNHTPMDSFDKKVEATAAYLSAMGMSWELLYTNDVIAIIRYGELTFGLPPELVECHPYTEIASGSKANGINAIVPAGGITKASVLEKIPSVRNKIEDKNKEIEALEEKKEKEIDEIRRQITEKYKEQFDLIDEKKKEMEIMMDQLEKQLFVLDTELYSIRCFMGETIIR